MNRRYFLPLLPAALAPLPRLHAAKRKVVVALFDGFGPDYIEASDMPNLKRIFRNGHFKIGKGVIPSVTNVNNASLMTSSFPAEHGITTNFFFDAKTGESKEMESAEYLLRPTLLEKAKARGWKTALATTTKDKVRTLCSRGADIAVSAEKPAPEWLDRVGAKQNMYSAAVNYWTLRAARQLLRDGVDLLYLSTTDYMMHTYAPTEAPSLEHLHTLDKLVADLLDDNPGLEFYLTADHGMNAKREAIDPAKLLAAKGITAEAVPIIRDKHKVHHGNLGGACYVYLKNKADRAKANDLLKAVPGIEEVYDNKTAARQFRLHPDRIGDLFLLAAKDIAFGELDTPREATKVRTHGSRHEAAVPLIIHGRKVDFSKYEYNLDLSRHLDLERV